MGALKEIFIKTYSAYHHNGGERVMTRVQVMVDGAKQMKEMELESDTLIYNGLRYEPGDLSYQAPCTGTIYGVLMNDRDYVEKMESTFHKEPYHHPPVHPILYIKPINTVNAHKKYIPMPEGEDEIQVNGTLGMIIRKTTVNVTPENALEYVAGYTIVNDISIEHNDFHRPNIKNKVRDGFCPIGPWIVRSDRIPDPNDIKIRVSVNDNVKQVIDTSQVIRKASALLSEISTFMTFREGDVLLLGIFDGAPIAQVGDTVRIDVDEIGSLENRIIKETEPAVGGGVL